MVSNSELSALSRSARSARARPDFPAVALQESHPPIWSRIEGEELAFATDTLTEDDLQVIAARLWEILTT